MTSCAFITIHKDKSISINPYDMNMIITGLLARNPTKMNGPVALCLPGISDDGFLYFTVKFVTPNVIILFATLSSEDYSTCMSKANDISRTLEQLGIVKEITKHIKENYLTFEPILPKSKEFLPTIVKDNTYNQTITYNLSFFSITSGQRKKLRKMEEAYEKSLEPAAHKSEFEYVIKNIHETVYVKVIDDRTIIMLGSKYVTDKEFAGTAHKIHEQIIANEDSHYITNYLMEKN